MLRGMWDLPRPGLEPVSPALAGRFSTTAPPGKPEIEFFVVRWMDLESVIQSEVSQKEKNKYHMLTHIFGI